MIQFNLLPDVKIEYLKTRQLKRSIVSISVVLAVATVVVMLILLIFVKLVQTHHISDLNNQINSDTATLKNTQNLSKILTIQNQINALPTLANQKPVVSRLFTYISEITPVQATISQLNLNFQTNTITISGSADSLATVNKFVDTLEFSTYQLSSNGSASDAFSSVVLSNFGYDTTVGASYEITANFTPAIFSNLNDLSSLNVPNLITTRSQLDQPTLLFQPQPSSSKSSP